MSRSSLLVLLIFSLAPAGQAAREVNSGVATPRAEESRDASPETIRQLVLDLGNAEFAVRQQAQEQLIKLGFRACDALTEAANSKDLEIASRARYLLRMMKVEWTADDDPAEVRRILQNYESDAAEVRLSAIRELAALPAGLGVPGLCRVVRFEKSALLSKYAALAILEYEPAHKEGRDRLTQTLRQQLGSCARTAAQWLLAYADLRDKPAEGLAMLQRLVESEQQALRRSSPETNAPVVIWMVYQVALGQAEMGDPAMADKTARRALEIQTGEHRSMLELHLQTAYMLKKRGRFDWAEAEFRSVIKSNMPEMVIYASSGLAEMWHDKGDDLRAADELHELTRWANAHRPRGIGLEGADLGEVVARANYFLACHWKQQGDAAKQRQYLDAAVQADPTELDVLIACHHLAEADPAFRRKIAELVSQAAQGIRDLIQNAPEDADAYNQLAWLLGNAGGDFQEALKAAQRAVAMKPDSGAYYDTLGHVYAGHGDYENAVKHQARAAELEPHSGLIQSELAAFRKKLGESKSVKPDGRPDRGEG